MAPKGRPQAETEPTEPTEIQIRNVRQIKNLKVKKTSFEKNTSTYN